MNLYKIIEKIIPSRCREIPGTNGEILLQQVRISKRLYLHHFCQPEPEGVWHCHRWRKSRSFVFWGKYTEERLLPNRERVKITHKAPSTFSMGKEVVHRIHKWDNAWTIFWFTVEDQKKDWGYFDEDFNYTSWRDYIEKERRVKHV